MPRIIVRNAALRERAKQQIDGMSYPFTLDLKEGEPRNLDQNAALHAALTDIARQVEWNGKKLSLEVWKRLCMASWLREEREKPMMIPALDGNGVDVVYERTSKLSKAQCSSLLEWCYAFGAEQGVKFATREG